MYKSKKIEQKKNTGQILKAKMFRVLIWGVVGIGTMFSFVWFSSNHSKVYAATLSTVYVNATQGDGDDNAKALNQAAAACTTVNCASYIDEDTDSGYNDSDYVTNDQSESNVTQGFQLDDMPSSFSSMATINIKVRYQRINTGDDTVLLTAQIVQSDGSTALTTASSTLVSHTGTADGSFATITATGLTLTGTNNKTVWDGAELELTWTYSKSAGGDNQQIYVSAVELNGTYNPAPINISGTCQNYARSGNCADGRTVKVAVNSSLQAQSTTTSSGSWTISSVVVAPNDIVTVFIDGAPANSNKAVAVTKYDGSGSISSVALAEEQLTIGSSMNNTITNADIGLYDNTASGDADIFYEVDGSNNLTVDNTSFSTQEKLYIHTGDTHAPGANVTTNKMEVVGTYSAGSGTLTIEGTGSGTSRPLYVNGGTFTASSGTTTFTGQGATDIGALTYNTLNFQPTGSSPTYTLLSGTISATGTVTVGTGSAAVSVTGATNNPTMTFSKLQVNTSGTFTTGTGTLTLSGSGTGTSRPLYINGGTFTATSSGTTSFTGTSSSDIENTNYYNLKFVPSSGAPTFTLNSGTMGVSGNLTIGDATYNVTLAANTNNPSINLTGSLSIGVGSSYTKGSGTLTFNGTTSADWEDNNSTKSDMGAVTINGSSLTVSLGSSVKTTSVNIASSQALNLGSSGYTLTLTGSGTPLTRTGTLTVGTNSTVEYASSSGVTALASAATSYWNLKINGTGTFNSGFNLDIAKSLDVASGTLDLGTNYLSVGYNNDTDSGSITVAGTITQSAGGYVIIESSAGASSPVIGGAGSTTFYDLDVGATDDLTYMFTLGGNIIVLNDLDITDPGSGTHTLDLSTYNLTVGSTGVSNSGDINLAAAGSVITQSGGTTTVKTSSSGAATIGGVGTATFYNLTVAPDASGGTVTLGAGNVTVSNDLTVGNGTNTVTLTAETNDPILDVNGAVAIDTNATFNASSSSNFTVAGGWTNDGIFGSGTGEVTFDGSTSGNIDSGCATAGACSDQDFYDVIINKSSSIATLTLTNTDFTVQDNLTITSGILALSTLDIQVNDVTATGTAVSIGSNGSLTSSTGDLTLGGDLSNNGTVQISTSCGGADDALITSTDTSQRNWSGTGTFEISDVTISYMTSTPAIIAYSSTEGTNVGANWSFESICLGESVDLTISAWVKPNSSITSKAILVKNNEFRLVTNGSDQPLCQIYTGAWNTAVTSTTSLSTGTWQHVACSYNYNTQILGIYINGDLKAQSTKGGAGIGIDNSSTSWRIGSDEGGTYGDFNGNIDEVRIYNEALTPGQILDAYNFAPAPSLNYTFDDTPNDPIDPSAWWKFDENTGTTAYDETANNNDLETTNSTWTSSGKTGSALSFDGVNDVVTTADSVSLSPTSAITVEGWVKMDEGFSTGTDHPYGIVDKGAYQFYLDNSDGKAHWVLNDAAADAFSALSTGASGQIMGMAVINNELYVGGAFTSIGTCTSNCNYIAKWNGSTWSALDQGMNLYVYTLVAWNGELYVGGSFTDTYAADCANCNGIAKWDGSSWAPLSTGVSTGTMSTGVYTLTVWNDDLYAGGDFTSPGNFLAKWNGAGWTGISGISGGFVTSLTVWNGQLVVGGRFTSPGNYVARWNGSTWYNLSTGTNNFVYALGVWNGDLYVGGNFTSAGSCTSNCNYIAKWDGSWSGLNQGLNGLTKSITAFDGDLYIGGSFTDTYAADCDDCNVIAKWDGSSFASLDQGLNYVTYGIYGGLVWNGDLYLVGDFTDTIAADCDDCNRIAKWGTSNVKSLSSSTRIWGNHWTHIAGTYDGSSMKLYINGQLENSASTSITVQDTSNSFRIGSLYGNIKQWGSGAFFNGSVDDVQVYDYALIQKNLSYYDNYDKSGNENNGSVGDTTSTPGKFGSAVKFDGVDDVIVTPDSVSISPTSAITVEGWVKMEDGFSTGTDHPHGLVDKGAYQFYLDNSNGKAHWVLNDAAADAFAHLNYGFNEAIYSLAVYDGKLVVGGVFTGPGSGGTCTDCNHIASWDGSSWSALGYGFDGNVFTLIVYNGNLIAGGIFTGPGLGGTCTDCYRIASWNGSSWSSLGYGFNAVVISLGVYNGNLIAGGSFTGPGPGGTCTDCNRIASWNGSSWSSLEYGLSGTVYSLGVYNGNLIAGGSFSGPGSGGTCTDCNKIASWNGNSWSSLDKGLNSDVYGLAVYDGNLVAGGLFDGPGSGGTCANCNRIAQWNGSSWSSFDYGFNGAVYSLAVYNGNLIVGGVFTGPESGGTCTNCNFIAQWNGSSWSSLEYGFDSAVVYSLRAYNGNLIAGGGFTGPGSGGTCTNCNYIARWGTSATKSIASTTTSWTAGQWYHIAGTYDGSSMKIYVDGSLENSASTSITIEDTSHDLYIGAMHGSSHDGGYSGNPSGEFFKGYLDDFKIYNYARTFEQITMDLNGGHPIPGSPIGSSDGWWKFDEGYGDTAYDSSPEGNNGNLGGSGTTCPTTGDCPTPVSSGKFGKALSFDGTDDNVEVAADSSYDFYGKSNYSVCGWIYPDTDGEGDAGEWWSKGSSYVRVDTESGSTVKVSALLDLATSNASLTTTKTIPTGAWSHVCIVWTNDDDDELTIYVNGNDYGSSTNGSGDSSDDSANVLYIGGDTSNNFDGKIDEVKVYTAALDTQQVKAELAQGKAQVLGGISTDSSGNASWSDDRAYCPPGDLTSNCAPIAEWKFDEDVSGDAQSLYDTAGNGHTATTDDGANNTGMDCSIPGKQGSGCKIDGTDDYIVVADNDAFTFGDGSTNDEPFSISLWVNASDFTDKSLVAKRETSGLVEYHLYFDSSDQLKFSLFDATAANYIQVYTGALTTYQNSWIHINATYDGSEANTGLEVYVNGMQQSVTRQSNNYFAMHNLGASLGFGAYSNGTSGFLPGVIDMFRLYDYELSPAQIAWNYNKGAPVAHYKFDECSGTDAYSSNDEYNSSLKGTITEGGSGTNVGVGTCGGSAGTMWADGASGKFNGSLEFDDTDDYVSVTDTNELDLQNGLTISAWVKTAANEADNVIVSKGSSYEVGINADGDVYWDGVGSEQDDGSAKVLSGTWHNILITNDDTTVTYYVDGIKTGTDSAGVDSDNATALYIGYDGSNFFDGQIDDVRIYNYVLTPQQIRDAYSGGAAVDF